MIMLTKPLVQQKTKRLPRRAGAIECDEVLFSRLRELRKRLADERGVPAYVIFGDATLRQMARGYPSNTGEYARNFRRRRTQASRIRSHLCGPDCRLPGDLPASRIRCQRGLTTCLSFHEPGDEDTPFIKQIHRTPHEEQSYHICGRSDHRR